MKQSIITLLLSITLLIGAYQGLGALENWIFGYHTLSFKVVKEIGNITNKSDLYVLESKYHTSTPSYAIVDGDYKAIIGSKTIALNITRYHYIYIVNDKGINRMIALEYPQTFDMGDTLKYKVKGNIEK